MQHIIRLNEEDINSILMKHFDVRPSQITSFYTDVEDEETKEIETKFYVEIEHEEK